MVMGWLRRRRRLSAAAERRLLIALARAEEDLVRTHVQSALDVIDAVSGEMKIGRALELYLDEMDIDEPQSTIIAQRVLARLEDEPDAI
jgi:hypothetical protein